MFRNQYDHDVSIWSPQGRIHQIEYAMEAVKQGSAVVGLKNADYAILVVFKRTPSDLASYQEKVLPVDDHMGIAMAGLTADGRLLCRSIRRACANHKWAFEEGLPVVRMINQLVLQLQVPTQKYGRRPFGVGLLIAGYDQQGPHIYYLCPSANAYDCKCTAIGSRSQSARTYLERNFEKFPDTSLDQLINHGLFALKGTLPADMEINSKAYLTSSQLFNWKFVESDLLSKRQDANTNSLKNLKEKPQVLLTPEDESSLLKRYVFIMKTLFDKFTEPILPCEVFGFAAHYLKRFYLNHSMMDFYPREMMLTCLYLACKAADFPIGLKHFVSHIPRNQDRYSEFIANSELFLIESLNYDTFIHTPYRPFKGLLIDLVAFIQNKQNFEGQINFAELRSEGNEIIHKWFQSDLSFLIHPSEFALTVLVEIGKTHTDLDVELFLRDELCGCQPLKKVKQEPCKEEDVDMKELTDSESEENEEEDQVNKSPTERWSRIRKLIDTVHEYLVDFEFITELSAQCKEEQILDKCRNPLYDPQSEEYQAYKKKVEEAYFD